MTEKILLDTDIGSDIDDAVCLAYLLAQPQCELLGITTVSGEPVRRAMLASALCRVAGCDVPIYPGAAAPLLVAQKQTHAQQAAALSDWPHETNFPQGEAVDFLRRTIRAHPGEITLLTIGPLTNIALLFAADPAIPALLKRHVLMCGRFIDQDAAPRGPLEWNALLDPHATAMVYRAPARLQRSFGLDVTTQVVMDADPVRKRFRAAAQTDGPGQLLRPVRDFAEVWFEERQRLTFHDPLAAVCIFEEDICQYEAGTVDVELHAESRLGQTRWQSGPTDSAQQVALQVDADRFFEHYFGVFSA